MKHKYKGFKENPVFLKKGKSINIKKIKSLQMHSILALGLYQDIRFEQMTMFKFSFVFCGEFS